MLPLNSPIKLTTPLAADDLHFESMTYSSGLSTLEEVRLHMLSDKPDLMPDDLLGKAVTVTIELRDGEQRHINGYVSRFGLGRHQGRYFGYTAEVVPWLWFLTRRSDCRIFQDMSTPEIIKEVFKGHNAIASHEFKLTRQYRKRSYCVQYRETDYNFVARLMEDEGIYWYFEHTESEHKLIVVDMSSAHNSAPGYEHLPYYANVGQASPDVDYISDWNFSHSIRSGKVALTSYDFERPGTALKVGLGVQRDTALSNYEQFDFQGDYTQTSDGEQLLDNRIDEIQSRFEQLTGTTNAYGMATGHLFELMQHPRDDQNAEYLCVQAFITAQVNGIESGNPSGEFRCSFVAMPSSQQFRPTRSTPKPFVQGPQTAVVVGPSGEEIFTDKYGRVKVQFHWDRYGQKNEKSSCWMRVSSPWAGKSFGFIQIPRIGQEVVVDFLEGDPDQPLVTGRVYNADQMPPWDLPANASQSGLLTRSTKGGNYNNANALRFEDKKGSEQVWFHAEKNMDTEVENDETLTVGHDQTVKIHHHQKINVVKGREVYVEDDGETYYVKGLRKVYVKGHQEQIVTDGYDTIVTNERGEYTTGNRKCWTSGSYVFKSTEAYFDVGPLYFLKGTDFKFLASGSCNFEIGGDFNAKAANFKFSSGGNFDFTGNKFNRTIFEGNDTVLGANTNTYIGVSRDVAMGPNTEVYSGIHNSTAAGIDVSGFLGMQVSNFVGLSMANAASLAIENSALNFGFAGLDMTMAGLNLENNGFKVLNAGGGAGGAGASLSAGPTVVAAIFAAAGGGFALGFGGAAAMDAQTQANADIDTLLNNPALTPAVRERLRKAMDSRFSNPTAEQYSATISDAEIAAQTGALANGTPGAAPANDPTSSLGPPPASAPPH
ncbi:MAG: type VI secretion system tip protein VgrG [Burkholderiales bacterium]|nr:type VI secretion system tip protein VgrG [Burkholderiales bacterium]